MTSDDRNVTHESLERLLSALDENRERAGERYVLLRRKLVAFFDWRGASSPEDCADRTFDIAARRIGEGEVVKNLPAYCVGIARMVLLEAYREQERERSALGAMAAIASLRGADNDERRLQAIDQCLDALPAENRELILAYYGNEGASNISTRKQLAARLGIPLNALRIRACRIRAGLEESVRAMIGNSAGTERKE